MSKTKNTTRVVARATVVALVEDEVLDYGAYAPAGVVVTHAGGFTFVPGVVPGMVVGGKVGATLKRGGPGQPWQVARVW